MQPSARAACSSRARCCRAAWYPNIVLNLSHSDVHNPCWLHHTAFLPPLRTFEFQAVGTSPGDETATAQLTKPDSNPANDRDDAVILLWRVCGNPFGNGTRPACPALTSFVGPPAQPVTSLDDFGVLCCVSAALWPWVAAVSQPTSSNTWAVICCKAAC